MITLDLDNLLHDIRLGGHIYIGQPPTLKEVRAQIGEWGRKNVCTIAAELEGDLIRIDIADVPPYSPLRIKKPRAWHALEIGQSVTFKETDFPNVMSLRNQVSQYRKRTGQKIRVLISHGSICITRLA